MIELTQGSLVLVDFSYSDQTQSKLRPALVVSNSAYNKISRDVIVTKITSKKPRIYAVGIANEDLATGSLDLPSYVQADGIYALEKALICDKIGILKPGKTEEILNQVAQLLSIDPVEK
jgi:mRNA interferase MazF